MVYIKEIFFNKRLDNITKTCYNYSIIKIVKEDYEFNGIR